MSGGTFRRGGADLFRDGPAEEGWVNEAADEDDVHLADAGVASLASAQDAGELFEYVIQTPVSLKRRHSAMLPIVTTEIEGHKLSVFNPRTHPKHPLNGLKLKNTTGLHLMQGPVTVFDGGIYAGDAIHGRRHEPLPPASDGKLFEVVGARRGGARSRHPRLARAPSGR